MAELLEEYRTSKDIKEDLVALKIELAFQERFEGEMDALLMEDEERDPEIDIIMQSVDGRMVRLINRKSRILQVRQRANRWFPRIGKAFACLLLVIFIGLSTAVATVQSVRLSVLNFIIEIEDRYTSLYLEESRSVFEVPQGWQGLYYITYVPERFVLADCSDSEAIYVDRDGNILGFCEYEYGETCNLDTENADITYESIHGRNSLVIEKDGWIAITWSIGARFLVIDLIGTREEAFQIANSVLALQ